MIYSQLWQNTYTCEILALFSLKYAICIHIDDRFYLICIYRLCVGLTLFIALHLFMWYSGVRKRLIYRM